MDLVSAGAETTTPTAESRPTRPAHPPWAGRPRQPGSPDSALDPKRRARPVLLGRTRPFHCFSDCAAGATNLWMYSPEFTGGAQTCRRPNRQSPEPFFGRAARGKPSDASRPADLNRADHDVCGVWMGFGAGAKYSDYNGGKAWIVWHVWGKEVPIYEEECCSYRSCWSHRRRQRW